MAATGLKKHELMQLFYRDYYPRREIFSCIIWPMQPEEGKIELALDILDQSTGTNKSSWGKNNTREKNRYLRYMSVSNAADLDTLIRQNNSRGKTVLSIHFGGFYLGFPLPRLEESLGMTDLYENGFSRVDVDLDEYKKLRHDCCGALKQHCQKCWIAAICAMEQITLVAHNLLGVAKNDILFFYSGNKGIHSIILGLPHRKFYETLAVLNFAVHRSLSTRSWDNLCRRVAEILDKQYQKIQKNGSDIRAAVDCLFIRCDKSVAEQQLHLLKSPLSIHPSTLKFCCYIPHDSIESFNPEQVPRLGDTPIHEFSQFVKLNTESLLNRKNNQHVQQESQ